MLTQGIARTIFIITSLWFGFVFNAVASNLNGPPHCQPMKVWGTPAADCVDWHVDFSDRELTVLLQKRTSDGKFQPIHEFRLYSHYLRARVEWLPIFDARERVLSTLSEGQTGSNVSQTMWALVGFPQGQCKPYLVESLDAQQSISSRGVALKVSRHWIRGGEAPRIVLTYRLTQREAPRRMHTYRWRDTLAWDNDSQQFSLQSSRGDRHEVRSRIQAYRQQVGSLTCERLRHLATDGDFGLTTILEDQ